MKALKTLIKKISEGLKYKPCGLYEANYIAAKKK